MNENGQRGIPADEPAHLSRLALLSAHAPAGARVFELACGTGAFLRVVGGAGADVVWAKLWLAKRYVAPDASLACFDTATGPWPLEDGEYDVAFCHDALYFLPEKAHVVDELRRVAKRVLIGHAHNAEAENHSAGEPLTPAGYRALLGQTTTYDGRVDRRKGALDLIEAAAGLDARVVVSGIGPDFEAARALAAERGVDAQFPGSVPYERVPQVYRGTVFASPTYAEGFSNIADPTEPCRFREAPHLL